MGEYLEDAEYHRFQLRHEADGMVWGHSPALNLDLCWDNGRLRFYNPATGLWLMNREEEHEAAQAERAAWQAAGARAAELEAELQRLRGEAP